MSLWNGVLVFGKVTSAFGFNVQINMQVGFLPFKTCTFNRLLDILRLGFRKSIGIVSVIDAFTCHAYMFHFYTVENYLTPCKAPTVSKTIIAEWHQWNSNELGHVFKYRSQSICIINYVLFSWKVAARGKYKKMCMLILSSSGTLG